MASQLDPCVNIQSWRTSRDIVIVESVNTWRSTRTVLDNLVWLLKQDLRTNQSRSWIEWCGFSTSNSYVTALKCWSKLVFNNDFTPARVTSLVISNFNSPLWADVRSVNNVAEVSTEWAQYHYSVTSIVATVRTTFEDLICAKCSRARCIQRYLYEVVTNQSSSWVCKLDNSYVEAAVTNVTLYVSDSEAVGSCTNRELRT